MSCTLNVPTRGDELMQWAFSGVDWVAVEPHGPGGVAGFRAPYSPLRFGFRAYVVPTPVVEETGEVEVNQSVLEIPGLYLRADWFEISSDWAVTLMGDCAPVSVDDPDVFFQVYQAS